MNDVPIQVVVWGVQQAAAKTSRENFEEMRGLVRRLPLEMQALYASLLLERKEQEKDHE